MQSTIERGPPHQSPYLHYWPPECLKMQEALDQEGNTAFLIQELLSNRITKVQRRAL